MDRFDPAGVLHRDLDVLLASGGDSRSVIDPRSHANRYRCTAAPRPNLVPLGSCTASTITENGYLRATHMLNRLRAVGGGPELEYTIEECYRNIRADLRHMLARGQVDNLGVVLTPSGTDAELLACLLVSSGHERPICNVIVGPTELGSGTLQAANCRHFDALTPMGQRVEAGTAVAPDLTDRIDVYEVALRDGAGAARSTDDIDAEIRDVIATRIARGEQCLLHVTAHSKTGAHAPSLGVVEELKQRYGERLDVVVDAAQGRFSRRGLVRILRLGYLVIITGSKFYGGPAFAGAVLVPIQLRTRFERLTGMPEGFDHYFTRAQLPTSWHRLRASLPPPGNIGLLLRWSAAIGEMRDYYAVPSVLRLRVLREFERLVPVVFSGSPVIQLDAVSPPIISDDYERLLQSKATVFSFRVWDQQRQRFFSVTELRSIFEWMDADLSYRLTQTSTEARRALAATLQIGQPVRLGGSVQDDVAVLRIANGGVLISAVAENVQLGAVLGQRLGWMEDQLLKAKRKIETCADHFAELSRIMQGESVLG